MAGWTPGRQIRLKHDRDGHMIPVHYSRIVGSEPKASKVVEGAWYHLKRAFRPEADLYKEGRNKSQ